MVKSDIINKILEDKIIVIMRGLTTEQAVKTVEAMSAGGISLVEITFDQSGRIPLEKTAEDIKTLCRRFSDRVLIGAGTVMTAAQVDLAYGAGAKFIISPDTNREVIERTGELEMVSIPGAFTPTEAAQAYRYGADFVKLFPNGEVKLSYLKALMLPLSHIRFLAVGGVNDKNIREYLDAGVCGFGIATGIVNKQMIASENYDGITGLAKLYCSAVRNGG